MGWFDKEHPTPFDDQPVEGLHFLDGDVLARRYKRNWTEGQKYPQVMFPSGLEFPIWEAGVPGLIGIIHLFGEMDLPYSSSRMVKDIGDWWH